MKKFLPTIFLVLLLLGLGLFYFLYEKNRPTAEERRDTTKEKVLDLNKNDIQEISLVYPNKTINLIKQKDGSWQSTLPNIFTANQEKVSDYLLILVNLPANSKLANVDQEESGLTKPVLQIIITAKNHQQTLLIGQENALESGIYLQKLEDSKFTYLVEKDEVEQLKKNPDDFK